MRALGRFGAWWQSVRRKGRSSRHAATDPGDALFDAQMAALDAALPARINVVGNARSLLDAAHGPRIDAAATIRFNASATDRPESRGTRWDFVATSHGAALDHWSQGTPPFHTLLFTPYFDLHLPVIARYAATPVLTCPMRLSIELTRKLGARPTTGAQILWMLHRLRGREVEVFGFDWKTTLTQGHARRRRDVHDHARERQVIGALIAGNGWRLNR